MEYKGISFNIYTTNHNTTLYQGIYKVSHNLSALSHPLQQTSITYTIDKLFRASGSLEMLARDTRRIRITSPVDVSKWGTSQESQNGNISCDIIRYDARSLDINISTSGHDAGVINVIDVNNDFIVATIKISTIWSPLDETLWKD